MIDTELNGVFRHHESATKELDIPYSQRNRFAPPQAAEREDEQ
jgi:hypothetical protein